MKLLRVAKKIVSPPRRQRPESLHDQEHRRDEALAAKSRLPCDWRFSTQNFTTLDQKKS